MKYKAFKDSVQDFPVFSSSQISALTPAVQVLRNQLSYWKKQGLILQLKRGLYIFNAKDRKITPSRVFIANQLVSPSYVSTEYGLGFYDLIPERVEDVTSVTTKKTATFSNEFGVFRFQHIDLSAFVGMRELKDENGLSFFIAEPEKAIVDFIYLNLGEFKEKDKEIFSTSYRFQNLSGISAKKLRLYAGLFRKEKLQKCIENFIEFMKKEKG